MSRQTVLRIITAGAGIDVAEADYAGLLYRVTARHGVTMALARQLVAAGAPDQPWQAIGPDGRMWFSGPSLHRLAGLTINEPDRGRLRIARWTPNPNVPVRVRPGAASGLPAPAAPPAPASGESALAAFA